MIWFKGAEGKWYNVTINIKYRDEEHAKIQLPRAQCQPLTSHIRVSIGGEEELQHSANAALARQEERRLPETVFHLRASFIHEKLPYGLEVPKPHAEM